MIRRALSLTLPLLLALPARAAAQRGDASAGVTDRRFVRPHELGLLGGAVAASALLSVFDTRIARWTQSTAVQGSASRRQLVRDVTRVNETTLTLAGLAGYGVGRLTGSETITDVAAHTTESILLTSLVSQAIRGPLGRTRPYVSADRNQYDFQAFRGFTSFDNRAWPSLHSATAFAAGSALVGELRARRSPALPWATPLIYAAAALPGLSRMYLDQHWASDVLAGDLIGAVIGSRLVHYAHTSPPGAGPRWLVAPSVAPDGGGGVDVGLSLQPR